MVSVSGKAVDMQFLGFETHENYLEDILGFFHFFFIFTVVSLQSLEVSSACSRAPSIADMFKYSNSFLSDTAEFYAAICPKACIIKSTNNQTKVSRRKRLTVLKRFLLVAPHLGIIQELKIIFHLSNLFRQPHQLLSINYICINGS